MKKYILNIDPGLLTGMSLIDITDLDNPVPIWATERNVKDFYRLAEETVIEYQGHLTIVCENFIITAATAKKEQAPWSLRGCGVMEFLSLKYNVPMVLQTPVDMKNFSTHENLKKIGFWYKGGEGHANDSYGHGLLYLVRIHPRLAKKLL